MTTKKLNIKFGWIDAVATDPRLSTGERFVLICTVLKYVRHNADTFRVRQATIAERFFVSRRLVESAIADAKQFGYLRLVEQRKRGRGHLGGDVLRIEIPADCAGINGLNTRTDCSKDPHGLLKIPARPNASTSGNYDPHKGLYKGLKKGTASAPTSHDFTEPPRYCQAHQPDGTTNPCTRCKTARENYDAWEKQRQQQSAAERTRIRAAIDNCDDCDSFGRLNDLTDCPQHPNFRTGARS